MKKVTVLGLVIFISVFALAQKVYFVYLQNEDHGPFFVKMNEKIFSSSPSGYLILSNLKDSSYNVNIGFPSNQWPDQKFSFTVSRKDQGFLLKNFTDKGWGLFNIQTSALQMAAVNKGNDIVKSEKKEVNTFTEMLSKAADDSTLKEKQTMIITEEKKPVEIVQNEQKVDSLKPELKKEDLPVVKKEEIKPAEKKEEPPVEIKEQPVQTSETKQKDTVELVPENQPEEKSAVLDYRKSNVVRRSESSTTEGFGLVLLDIYPDGTTDTIRILIPNNNRFTPPAEIKQEEKKFLEILPADTVQEKTPVEKKETAITTDVIKNNCNSIASEDDFFKLRKKMAGESRDESMITEARKIFRTKCFTTQQIRNLSLLFLGDEGKYNFFDAAYKHVFDVENFASLEPELKGEYFINRFKAMLR